MDNIQQRINNAAEWLLNSGIQNTSGEHYGGINCYYTGDSYPYVYSEITGYGISAFLYLNKFYPQNELVERARIAAKWITKKALLTTSGVKTRYYYDGRDDMYSFSKGNSFVFDTSMALYGITMLYYETNNTGLLDFIKSMSNFLLLMQKDNGTFYAYSTKDGNKITSLDKWSNQSSSFHSKVALSLFESSKILRDERLREAAIKICEKAKDFMKADRFITNTATESTDTHPSLYSAEGLVYMGIYTEREDFLRTAARSVSSVMNRFTSILPSYFNDTSSSGFMRMDTVAQTLRLCSVLGQKGFLKLDSGKMERLFNLLAEKQVESGAQKGGFIYGTDDDGTVMSHPNSWVTMFATQAMIMYKDYLNGKEIEIKPFV